MKKITSSAQELDRAAGQKMSLMQHLAEFRKRLVMTLLCFVVVTGLCFSHIDWLVQQLIARAQGFEFVYISPSELVMAYLKLALTGGLVLASPMIIYQIWAFVRPGLNPGEKRVGFLTLFFGMILFLVGASFAYFIAMPFMLAFFMTIDSTQTIRPMISFEYYMGFVTSTLLTFGLVFEMPIVTVLLTQVGLVKPAMLVKSRRLVIVLIFVVAAVITPPDVVSQILVAIPMLILYEISVVVCKVLDRQKKKKAAADEAECETT